MGTYEQLKAAVAAVIHENGAEEITGDVMQQVLLTIINSLGAGATFAGVAVPTTNPSSPDAKMFYLAGKAGTYTNFNLTITKGLWVFENTTGSWVGHDLEVSMLFASGQDVTSTNIAATYSGAGNNDLVTVGAMNEALAGIVGSVALRDLDSTRTAGLYRVIGVQSRVVGYLQVNTSLSGTYVIQFIASDIFDFDDGYTADYKGHILTRSYSISGGTWSAWDEYGGGKFASGEKVADVSIAQTLGNSQTSVSSQKAVTDAIYNLIDIANIDAMKNDATLRTGGALARYTATTTLQGVTYKVGILDVMSDSAGHVLTQILTTHYTITSGVLDTSSHTDGAVRQYYRSVKINGGTLPTTDWTLWKPINDEQLDVLSAAVDAVKASVGYYACDTAAGTAAKVVSATGYELATGGCIRIKMDNANTADSVTLNINSTGAKALYYNGVQASSTNSWEAGEVLEVYYDGTQYQAAVSGGDDYEDDDAWDYAIADNNGHIILCIKDGHIYTKYFKSSTLTMSVGDVDKENCEYAVMDSAGHMAFAITGDGHIVTKNFSSRNVSAESLAMVQKLATMINKFSGKTMAVIGDSISTYDGYIPTGWRCYYPAGNVNDVSLTYWKQVADFFGMIIQNCAYSASYVTGDSTQTAVSASHEQGECAGCSEVRIAALTRDSKTPDIVLILLGTNDYNAGKALGTWDEHSAIVGEGTINIFSEAYSLMLNKIKTVLPNSRIFCCTILQRNFNFPDKTISVKDYNEVIKEMASIFGCDVIDTYACGISRYNISSYTVDGAVHPNAAGHALIASKVITELISKY